MHGRLLEDLATDRNHIEAASGKLPVVCVQEVNTALMRFNFRLPCYVAPNVSADARILMPVFGAVPSCQRYA